MAASCTLLELPLDIFIRHSASASPLPRRTPSYIYVPPHRVYSSDRRHFLVAATARQVGVWASLSSANATTLRTALRNGMGGLLDVALGPARAGLTMERIHGLYEMRFATINPVVDLIDKCVGDQWFSTPNFWDGGVDDARTLNADPPEAFFQLAVYGSLFWAAFDAYLATGTLCDAASVETRLGYVKYCIPDWACYMRQTRAGNVLLAARTIDPRRAVGPVGPYVLFASDQAYSADFPSHDPQDALAHLFRSTRWWSVVLLQGLEGMEMIRPGKVDLRREKLVGWRERIGAMVEGLWVVRIGRQDTHVHPDIRET